MSRRRRLWTRLVAILLSGGAVAVAAGCANLDSYKQAVAASERSITAVSAAVEEHARVYQWAIVDKAPSEKEGKDRLLEYQEYRAPVLKAIDTVVQLDAIGRVLITAVENGKRPVSDLDAWLMDLLPAILAAKNIVSAFLGAH